MHTLPPRPSLTAHSAEFLRGLVQSSEWQDFLPSERTLCKRLGISRPTLRVALAQLEEEGVLEPVSNKRRRLLPAAISSPKTTQEGNIALLSPMPLHDMPPFVLLWVDQLRGQLANEGIALQVHVGRAEFAKRSPQRALATLVATSPDTTWVLYQSTAAMQRWFADSGQRCVVVGSLPSDITLPAVDRDYRAACRHAVGLMRSRGHEVIGMLIQTPQFGGDLASLEGFNDGLQQSGAGRISGQIWQHDGTPKGIADTLQKVLAARRRPTALLVARSAYALTVVSWLQGKGTKIPDDLAILCRDDDAFLDHVVPRITRYAVNPTHFAKHVFRLIKGGRNIPGVQVLPTLLDRESL